MNERHENGLVLLTIKSTHRGFLARYLWCLFWIGIMIGVTLFLEHSARATYEALGVSEWEAFRALPHATKKHAWFLYPLPLLYGGINVLISIAAFFSVRTLSALIFRARGNCTFYASDGRWCMVEQVHYVCPFGKRVSPTHFDRIIDVTIRQNRLGLDRLFDTGTLTVVFGTAIGSGVVEHGVRMRAIQCPREYKRQLVALDNAYREPPLMPRMHARATTAT